jgi:hypothetical protein
MKRRTLFFAIAIAVLVAGFSALDARAGSLPASLSSFVNADGTSNGASATVVGAETLTFSSFTYTSSSSPPPGSPGPPAATFTLNPYTVGNETGFSMNGTFFAAAGTTADVTLTYTVTAPAGQLLNDALLLTTGSSLTPGGTGGYTVGETLITNTAVPSLIGTLTTSSTSQLAVLAFPPGVNSINVTKDIFLNGGSGGESLSAITQAFSSSTVPEPASLALLGIGMTGFLAFRRFFKKTAVA